MDKEVTFRVFRSHTGERPYATHPRTESSVGSMEDYTVEYDEGMVVLTLFTKFRLNMPLILPVAGTAKRESVDLARRK